MEVFRDAPQVFYEGTVVALGNFDGLHVAHMQIIRNGIKYAREHELKSGVLLFEENTKNFTGKKRIELITPNTAKLELLEREDLDFVVMRRFTHEVMEKSPEEFFMFLVNELHAKAVCCGYDYSFGYKAAGRVDTLRELGAKYGVEVLVTDMVTIDDTVVSSTVIREMIKDGDMERSEKFLGRRYCVEGPVVKGLQNGTRLGFPTVNVCYDAQMALPKPGVYAGITYARGGRLKSVINVGKNPTFGAEHITVESHILDYDENLYGEYVRVSFAKRLRGEIKFESLDALKTQIAHDAESVRGMIL
ncbi:MAG: bifunctional riboflavin kinase/FAD synthetase [bacterium]|nr:bifunctional riboflavin kinase/FAD synthetase [bacterium]